MTLTPINKPFRATIAPPGSKSLTNRALVLAALAEGISELSNVLFADDTLVMLDGLAKLGFQLEIDRDAHRVIVHGRGGQIGATDADLFCGNSGTTIRFLAAMCALGHGEYTLDGVPRMRQRPIRDLVDLLRNLGVRVQYLGEDGFPPLKILADGLPGGILQYSSTVSSQYLSAVLMASPYARHEVRVDLVGEQTSWPYVAMTMQLMDRFGHTPELLRDPSTGRPKQIVVPTGRYAATQYNVEPDASNATYFLAAAAVQPGSKVTIEGLGKGSLQGDVGFADVLRRMGADLIFGRDFITIGGTDVLDGIEVDLRDMPDTAQTLAVVALFARGETIIHGLHTLRVKETDRLAALSNELQKFGAAVTIDADDTLTIDPPKLLRRAEVDTYDDHRMAMSFAIAGTRIEHVMIRNAECVNKTYPEFFADLEKLRTELRPA
ncbi:MAG TPA: 3-phosphoshikimate 1-carboxyvinyltransferase [Tepidisphaeraceae bacterium]|nr:3-phosphoshikimate 1-carboxyvinyltransferase [Tepidisphaeraceae bacterium]